MSRPLLVLSLASFLVIACSSSSSSPGIDGGTHDGGKTTVDADKTGQDAKSGGDGGSGDSGLAAGQCRKQSDCNSTPGGGGCYHYTFPAFCSTIDAGGLSTATMCTTNAECADAGPNEVCGSLCRIFMGGAEVSNCSPGCTTDADCASARVCNASHSCVAAPCTTPTDCGPNYTCTGGSCAEKPCTTDSECEGYCVESYAAWQGLTTAMTCSPTLGSCAAYVP